MLNSKVDFGSLQYITGIQTEGDPITGEYVATFSLLFSKDCHDFTGILDASNENVVMVGHIASFSFHFSSFIRQNYRFQGYVMLSNQCWIKTRVYTNHSIKALKVRHGVLMIDFQLFPDSIGNHFSRFWMF